MSYMICTNLESCPVCDKRPSIYDVTWRIMSLNCECGKGYGGVIKNEEGEGTGRKYWKIAIQQWQDGARKEKGSENLKCKFRYFETEEQLDNYAKKKGLI